MTINPGGLLLLIVFVFAAYFVFKILLASEKEKQNSIISKNRKINRQAIKMELEASRKALRPNEVTKWLAYYEGDHPAQPYKKAVTITASSTSLTIFDDANGEILFSIPFIDVTDVKSGSPTIPYVMNLNTAAIAANAITRLQVGNSASVSFLDKKKIQQSATFSNFKNSTSESLVALVYSKIPNNP